MIDEDTRKRIREDAEAICKLAGLPELVYEVAKLLPIIEFEHNQTEDIIDARTNPPPPPDGELNVGCPYGTRSGVDDGWEWFAKKSWVPNLRGRLVEMTGWEQTFKRRGGNPGTSRNRKDKASLEPLNDVWPTIMEILPQWPVFDTEHDDDTKCITTVPMNPSAKLAYLITTWLDPAYTAANCNSVQTLWKARKHRKGVKQKRYPKKKKN